MNELPAFFEHLWISVAGSVIGLVLGILAGIPIARVMDRIVKAGFDSPGLLLIPWRTVMAGMIGITYMNYIPLIVFGVTWKSGLVDIIMIIAICTISLIVQVAHARATSHPMKHLKVSLVRSLFVFSPLLLGFYTYGISGGLGPYIYRALVTFEKDQAMTLGLSLLGVILAFDLFSGIVLRGMRMHGAGQD